MRHGSIPWSILSAFVSLGLIACEKQSGSPPEAERSGATAAVAVANGPAHAPPGAKPGSHEDWCGEHQVPESLCTRCNASLIPAFKATGDWCEAHEFPESVCPVCSPQNPPVGAEQGAIEARVVRLRSPKVESASGIETVAAQPAQASAAIACTARIAFDSDRIADIRAIVPGIVRKVRAQLGAGVKRGAPLFDLESTRVGEIQGALQRARQRARTAEANLERQQKLREDGISSQRQVEVAEQELATAQTEARTAETTLRMAGAARAAPSGRYTLSAPIAGSVVRRPAVVGLLATESESLATIADTSVMWALCDVSEADSSRVALGQKVVVTVEGNPGSPIEGELAWIGAEVDPRTRTVSTRAEVPNPEGRLRANQFARARIETSAPWSAVSVPRTAVQRVGTYEVVFVRTKPGVYAPRVVERHGDGERVQLEGRVRAGDAVVTTGAVLLRTEIMPGSIGAGCCEVAPPRKD
jgi:cobalt-zinc-cadmium efflux system membrane fusion protein